MSLPSRSSVWSASSAPGTAGSGICFTQTTTFMATPVRARMARRVTLRSAGVRPTSKPIGPPGDGRPVPSAAMAERGRCRRGGRRARRRAPPAHRRTGDAGLDVAGRRQGPFPRDKTCGDGLTTAGPPRSSSSSASTCANSPATRRVRETVLVSPSGRRVRPPPAGRRRCTPRSCHAPSSTPRSSTPRARRASTCAKATRVDEADRVPAATASTPRRPATARSRPAS